jgi:hypothetical protein
MAFNPFHLSSRKFGDQILIFKAHPSELQGHYDYDEAVKYHFPHLLSILRLTIRKLRGIRFQISFICIMAKERDDEIDTTEGFFQCEHIITFDASNLENLIWFGVEQASESLLRFCVNGSGWIFQSVEQITLTILSVMPVQKTTGGSYIALPSSLIRKNGLINIRNDHDDFCFLWCVLCHIYILVTGEKAGKHLRNPATYEKYLPCLNFSGLDFPMTMPQIDVFETMNPISINVFQLNEENITPLRLTKTLRKIHVNLLLITQEDGEMSHFVYIANLSNLLGRMGSKAKYFCNKCLKGFADELKKVRHELNCSKDNVDKVTMPSDHETVVFRNFYALMKIPFVIYADFECLTKAEIVGSTASRKKESYTKLYQRHIPYSYGLAVLDSNQHIIHLNINRGNDIVERFMDELDYLYEVLDVRRNIDLPIKFTEQNKIDFDQATTCWMCEEPFENESRQLLSRMNSGKKDLIKCAHHNHLTGEYIGACHSLCNLQLKYKHKAVPIIIHNLKSYDSHLILSGLKKARNIFVIPSNSEHYMSITVDHKFKFIDSFQFLPSSLQKLVSELPKNGFTITKKVFEDSVIDLVSQKGVFPYDFVDTLDKLNMRTLPSKSQFYNKLYEEEVTNDDYARAVKVWRTFGIRNLGEYSDLYLTTDVILLAEVFEAFRELCIENHRLDPCHYVSSPGLAWDAMLRMTKTPIGLLPKRDMYDFVERGIRGGIAVVSKRYAEANNPIVGNFDSGKDKSYIMYYDFVNLYGWAMTMKLPYKDFRWLSDVELVKLEKDLLSINTEGEDFYALEVDLEYPRNLHDIKVHIDLPLAVDKRTIDQSMLSPFQKNLLSSFPQIKMGKVPKLVPSFLPKFNYVCHLKNLQFYLQQGLKLKKIHRVLTGKQMAILSEYIALNSKRRQQAIYKYIISFWKGMNNHLFGKCMQNVRNLIDVKVITTEEQVSKYGNSPLFYDFREISESMCLFLMKRSEIKLDKPIFLGFAILELSKLLVYHFHYSYVGTVYRDRFNLLNIDTDGLMYEIFTENVYNDMKVYSDIFDLSEYPIGHFLHCDKNKMIPGKVKDEKSGKIIKAFAAPKAKMHSLEVMDVSLSIHSHKRAKGIKRNTVEKTLCHEDYKKVVLHQMLTYAKMNTFRSKSHQVGSYEIKKIGLHSFDDKRYLYDPIHSVPFGHYRITSNMME